MYESSQLVYSRVETHQAGDFLITYDVHIVEVNGKGFASGFVATCSSIISGCWGFDSKSQSFVFDKDHYEDAINYCEDYLNNKRGEE